MLPLAESVEETRRLNEMDRNNGEQKEGASDSLLIAWTTLDSDQAAQALAEWLITADLAVCVQVDGPIRSIYRWKGEVRSDDEWRVTVKFLRSKSAQLEHDLLRQHPYETPEWIVVRPEQVSEKYFQWATRSK